MKYRYSSTDLTIIRRTPNEMMVRVAFMEKLNFL